MNNQYIAPKTFKYDEINKDNCQSSNHNDKKKFHNSIVKNNEQIHHNLECPEHIQKNGVFNIDFPGLMGSSINEMLGDDGYSKTLSTFLDLYGNYISSYQKVLKEVEDFLKNVNEKTPASELHTLLFDVLGRKGVTGSGNERRGKTREEIQKAYDLNISKNKQLTLEYFKQVAISLLIEDEVSEDEMGTSLKNFCKTLKEVYCNSLDEDYETKEKIYNTIKMPVEKLDQPASTCVEDIAQYTRFDSKHPTLANKIDYSKSPVIAIKFMISRPQAGQQKASNLIISPQIGQVLWTTVYDFYHFPTRTTPIQDVKDLEPLIYRKGDTKNGKSAFRLLQKVTTVAPTVFWGEVQKKGNFQFKATVTKIMDYIPLSAGVKSLSSAEYNDVAAEIREAKMRYGSNFTQTQNESSYNTNYDDDNNNQSQNNNGYNNNNEQQTNQNDKRDRNDDNNYEDSESVLNEMNQNQGYYKKTKSY